MPQFVQDMPPKGGYEKIPFVRIPAKQYFGGYTMILGYLGITFGSIYLYSLSKKEVYRKKIEARSAKIAIYPLLLAERDREYLKQLRINRDEEEKLMANVEGWVVGTYFGDPIYKTLPPDTLVTPLFQDYYAHAKPIDAHNREHAKEWF